MLSPANFRQPSGLGRAPAILIAPTSQLIHWMFDVGCWLLDVLPFLVPMLYLMVAEDSQTDSRQFNIEMILSIP